MNSGKFIIVAKSSILHIPEHYPSFQSTGLPYRPRLTGITFPNRYMENFDFPVEEFTLFAKLLNRSVHDNVKTDAFDKCYRFASKVELEVSAVGGKLSVSVTRGKSGQSIERDFGVERTPMGTFTPPAPRVEEIVLRQSSAMRFDFGWIILGRPHPLAEPLFEEVCHRDCVYIWHRVGGYIKLENGLITLKAGFGGSRFPTHALFINHQRKTLKQQGALGNLWVSDPADPKRVTASGPSEYIEFAGFGGGSFGGGGAGGSW